MPSERTAERNRIWAIAKLRQLVDQLEQFPTDFFDDDVAPVIRVVFVDNDGKRWALIAGLEPAEESDL